MKPFAAVQALLKYCSDKDRYELCGSCFRLWANNYYLTARHCISESSPDVIKILNCIDDRSFIDCVAIYEHPTADVAIMQVSGVVPEQFQKFKLSENEYKLGAPLHCFGFLHEWYQNPNHKASPGRVIGGIIQREFIHNDGIYVTPAFEFSVPIPIGMSGGPSFYAQKDDTVLGMAIGTIKSSVVVHGFTEYEDDKVKAKEKISEITRFGVILRLLKFKDWLESIIPTPE
jgi:hypothetical protein